MDQVLAHVGNVPFDLARFAEGKGIRMEAYSPIAHGEANRIEGIQNMAAAYGVTVAQLCIRYVIQLGMIALPKTSNPDRMLQNATLDFEIASEDMATLNKAGRLADYGSSSFFPVFGGKM